MRSGRCKVKSVGATAVALAAATLLSACGSDTHPAATRAHKPSPAAPHVPPAPLARALPENYRARNVWRANLTRGVVPETVVTSVGPPTGAMNFHPADLQVLSWDKLAKRWTVIFDAQHVTATDMLDSPQTSNVGPGTYAAMPQDQTPLLDPKADVTLGPVRFASLLGGRRKQLIFSASFTYGGSGYPSILAIVDFKDALANVQYTWYGEDLNWSLQGKAVAARSSYWTIADAHCCPARYYRFTVGVRHNGSYRWIGELRDERPWLGITVRSADGQQPPVTGPLLVSALDDHAPAAGKLRPGDLIIGIEDTPPVKNRDVQPSDSLIQKLSLFNAGDRVRLLVNRGGVQTTVTVRLGSLADSLGTVLPTNDYSYDAV